MHHQQIIMDHYKEARIFAIINFHIQKIKNKVRKIDADIAFYINNLHEKGTDAETRLPRNIR